MTWTPWQFIMVALAGWMNRQQQEVIEYLREENRILREKLGHKRIILNDAQKRRLATAAVKVGKDLLRQFGTLFSPDTLLKWHRWLVARKYDGSGQRGKRGPKPTKANMIRYMVFFVIDLATRRVEITGIHADPCETQMLQYARNLTDAEDGFLKGKRILIHDRDPLYTKKFRQTLRAAGVRSLKIPKQSPNLNAYAERFVWSIKHECLNKMILFGESGVRHAVQQYVEHYHLERPHKVLGRRIVPADEPPPPEGEVHCRHRLGGLLKSYHREAA